MKNGGKETMKDGVAVNIACLEGENEGRGSADAGKNEMT